MNIQMKLTNKLLFVAILITLSLSVTTVKADSHIVKTEEVEVTTEKEMSSWDKAKKETGEAAGAVGEAVKETTTETWQATKEGASKAADYTSEKSSQAWDKTKEVSKDAWEATKEMTNEAADAAKESYGEAKEKLGGAK